MLSLLAAAKIKGRAGANTASQANEHGGMMEIDEGMRDAHNSSASSLPDATKAKDDLLTLAFQVDEQAHKLRTLLQDSASSVAPEDAAVIDELVEAFSNELEAIENALLQVESIVAGEEREVQQLLDSIKAWVQVQLPGSEQPASGVSPHAMSMLGTPPMSASLMSTGSGKFMTPVRQQQLRGTPRAAASRRGSGIVDFDAFPHTPTLDQIGLSRGALEAMGYRRQATLSALRPGQSDSDSMVGPQSRPSFGSNSESITTPRLTYLRSSSSSSSTLLSSAGQIVLTSRASEALSSEPLAPPTSTNVAMSKLSMVAAAAATSIVSTSTPIVMNNTPTGPNGTSPFGATIFGGRPSDAFTSGCESEF